MIFVLESGAIVFKGCCVSIFGGGDYFVKITLEMPIPAQFKTVIQGTKLVTSCTESVWAVGKKLEKENPKGFHNYLANWLFADIILDKHPTTTIH